MQFRVTGNLPQASVSYGGWSGFQQLHVTVLGLVELPWKIEETVTQLCSGESIQLFAGIPPERFTGNEGLQCELWVDGDLKARNELTQSENEVVCSWIIPDLPDIGSS